MTSTTIRGAADARSSNLFDRAVARLKAQTIETPSWAYMSSGTRFKVFTTPGTARDVDEKVDDAALVHELTGVAQSLAIHIPWDRVDDYGKLRDYAKERGIRIGSVNPNLFQDDAYRLGSVTNPDASIRRKAVDHILECLNIMRTVGSSILSLWFPDGTNYPGQDDFRLRRQRMLEALQEVYESMDDDMRMLVEYKFYEPAFYHTVISDWGQSLTLCQKLGDRAQVLVDLGHHAQGVNIEHIVATLLDEGRLGGFDLNSRKYGDDDLIVGVIDPQQLFLIFSELAAAEESEDLRLRSTTEQVLYKLDQCHMVEENLPAIIQSVMNLQTAYAKAVLVDRDGLRAAQEAGDVVGANRLLTDAYETDVRPLLARVRKELGVASDPYAAYVTSDKRSQRTRERVGAAASW